MAIKAEAVKDNFYKTWIQERGGDAPGLGASSVVGPLAGLIYHDLRHPLTAILAYSELLAEDDLDMLQRKDFHQEIRLAVSRMDDLISSLMECSKGPENFRPEIADIVETVKHAIQVVAIRSEFGGIVIRYDHEGLREGYFGLRGLEEVITNIVLNACEAVQPDSGTVHVTSVGRQDFLEISISDNGPGIPDPIRHAVFQPFVSYGKEWGTGLGLAIVQKILHDQGGEVYIDTTGEEGTKFRLVLPYMKASREWLEVGGLSKGSMPLSVKAILCCGLRPLTASVCPGSL